MAVHVLWLFVRVPLVVNSVFIFWLITFLPEGRENRPSFVYLTLIYTVSYLHHEIIMDYMYKGIQSGAFDEAVMLRAMGKARLFIACYS